METNFDTFRYIQSIGKELVTSFDHADLNTTPGQVGASKENSVRNKLQQILPVGIAVGSGFVIDSFGNTSRQMDVVLYEKEICPVYCINDSTDSTYYPCEGVVAVGEIKSSISRRELDDIFRKIESVKKLKRSATRKKSVLGDTYIAFRKYGSYTEFEGDESENYNQELNPLDQIFGFSLAGNFRINSNRILDAMCEHNRENLPNLMLDLNGKIFYPIKESSKNKKFKICDSFVEATGIGVCNEGRFFEFLISTLHNFFLRGRTVSVREFDRYFSPEGVRSLQVNNYRRFN